MVSVVEGAALPLYAAERPQRAGGRSVESKAADILVMARSLVGPSSRRAAPGPRAKRGAPPRCKSQATVVTGVSQSQRAFASLRSTEYRSATMRDLMARQGSVDAWRGGDGDGGAEEPHFLKRPQAVEELDSDDAGGHRSRRGSRESRAGETRATEAFANSTDLASVSWHAVHGAAPAPAPAAPAGFSFGASQAELRAEYDARFSGLHGYGASGMTRLEEMVEAAMGASVKARRESQANDGRCAALLARSGAMYITRSVRSKTDPALSVGCERAAVLRAVSDGDTAFVGLVVVDCASDEIPAPDGGARQFLAEYGDFPVYLVNRGLSARRVTTHELFPLRSLAAPPRDAQPDDGPRSKKPRRRRLRIAEAPAPPESASSDAAPAFRKAPPKRRLRVTSDVDSDGGRRGGAFASARRENTSDEAGALRRRENTSDEASSDGGRADKRAVGFSRQRAEPASGESSAGSASGELPAKATDWSIDDVCEWLEFDVRVPAYAVAFRRAKVNGALLLRVDGDDLEATLEVKHALHRRRILAAIDALRDEALKQGAEQVLNAPDEVDAYFGTIDKERVRAVARLKVAFDAHATKRASDQVAVGVEGVRLALTQLGRDSSQWRPEGTYWTFLDFVDLYVENFSQDDPDLKASSGAAAALSERVRVLVSGHVELRPDGGAGRPKKLLTMGSAGGANGSRSRGAFGSPASRSRSGSASSEASQFGGGEGRRARERDATKAAKAADSELGSVRRLAELKQVFDRFAVHEAVTGAEALQALTELGCGCPRKAAAAYFRGRGFYGMRRDVSFFEFLRAFAALELEGDGPQKRPARSPSPEGRFAAPKSRRRSPSRSSGSSVDRAVDRLTRKPHSSLQQHVRRRRESRRGDKSSSDEGRSGFSSRGRQSARSSSRSGRASPPRSGRASPPRRSAQRRDDDSDDGRRRRAPAEDLRVGDRVEARFKKRATFYPGVIKRVHADGTFDVDYDDGEQETRVSAALIEVKARPKAAKAPRLNEGDKVEARYRGRSKFYPGKIVRDRGDGTFDIDYDDGEKESRIDEKLIKAVGGGSSPSSRRGRLSEGAKVEARYRGRSKFYPGRITRDRGDGTFDIDYDDGEKETRVDEKLINALEGASPGKSLRGDSGGRMSVGDKVEAHYKGRSKLYKGEISRVNADGTFDIAYDDGERETRVTKDLIKQIGGASGSDSSPPPRRGRLSEGAKVEARYRGKSKFYPGRITRDRGDGTFDIDYDDGEKESRVLEDLIKAVGGGSSPSPRRGRLSEGAKVEARYRGRSKFYPGRITRDRGDGTFDIDYDDGEKETRVDEKLINALEGASPGKSLRGDSGGRMSVGDKVEAHYKGRSKLYKGEISRVNADGTFDIAYDDGERETRVTKDLIKQIGGASVMISSPPPRRGRLSEGAKVEARYRGKSKFYPGRITRDRGDGTFDIDYDDGEKESRVLEDLIKAVGGGSSPSPRRGRLSEGAKVEARYRGRSKFYPGRITRDRGDGTFDIDYDDGEKETRVDEKLINALEGASPGKSLRGDSGGRMSVGDKVEAHYKGRSKLYKGEISRVNADGTFDIAYDDGERETRVTKDLIKQIGGASVMISSPPPRRGRLSEGAKVEARYRGRSKFYPGRITRDRGDGTFDIDYDDGEKETRVDEKLINALEGASPGKSLRGDSGGRMSVGDKVEAHYKGRSKLYKGEISRVNADGTFDIAYDDGERETRVTKDLIKQIGGASGSDSSPPPRRGRLSEGAKVEARYRGKSKFYPGRITRDRGDGTFDIDYDDGEKESRVLEDLIKAVGGGSSPPPRRGGGSSPPPRRGRLSEGAKVEARYRGRSKFYPGCVTRDRGDGTFDIDYDDGEKETRVDEKLINALEGASPGKSLRGDSGGRMSVGDKVEAHYKGRSKLYKGEISRVNADGTFDIAYNDGERETRVTKDLIKQIGGASGSDSSPPPRRGRLSEGAKVEARYRGKSKFYPGRITRDRGDGTFDIDYDDGEKESRVLEDLIKAVGGGSSPSPRRGRLSEGAKVEARYRGRSKFYPGRITRDRGDGTFDIDYDDGEKETRVDEKLINALEGASPGKSLRGDSGGRMSVGDKVEAHYKGRSKLYKGEISRVNADGTFDIAYDDGERETRVTKDLIKQIGGASGSDSSPPPRRGRLSEGAKVEARYRGKSKFYPGRITRDRGDGTFDIDYDDGEKESRVLEDLIKAVGGGSSPSPRRGRLSEGAKVEARYRGRSKFYPGRITRDRGDGTFDIDYDDGEKETRVDEKLINALEGASPGKSLRGDSGGRMSVGDKVEALYKGRSKLYKGEISRVNADGTFDIAYDDGERETRVTKDLIKQIGGASVMISSPPPRRGRLSEGAKVEARYRGRSKFYPGRITRDRGDGTFDIDYDDGEKETRVDEKLINALEGVSPGKSLRGDSGGRMSVGDKVEAHYKGRSKLYKGEISRVNADGTFDIAYDDGERETRVTKDLIKQIGGASGSDSSPPPRRGRLSEGAKVEARYRGKSKFYPGRITRDRGDGTFDIDYDDGEKESRVLEDLIKAVGGGSSPPPRRGGGSSPPPRRGRLSEGAKVEARYRGRSKYYPGRVTRDRGDGTFDIDYDDGEKETRVDEKLINALEGASPGKSLRGDSGGRMSVGDKVEAHYKGRSKLYKGEISRVNADGTFDIAYDDGERETRVTKDLIKQIGGASVMISSPPPRRGRLSEGAKVEARYRGKSKFYPGRITRDRGDGTFDIDYDDGEKESRVLEDLIKAVGGGSSPSPRRGRLSEGAKVEARYRGRSKFYPGRITRDRGDGTFDIDYDDGEKETRVDEKLINALEGASPGKSLRGDSGGRMSVGDKVEAHYKGRSKLYKGEISRVNADGTFDIAYNDGERETRVTKDLIKQIGGASGSDSSPPPRRGRLSEGAKVEARYRGKSKFYPGRITRDRGDGTFDIDYDDGEKESRVLEDLIKAVGGGSSPPPRRGGGSSPSPRRGRLSEGAKVEARYRGRSKFYPGRITRDRGDGTFDIDYDDGEKESRVLEDLIKAVGGGSSPPPRRGGGSSPSPRRGRLSEGAKVEARYRGRSKYYPGRITRDRDDGTFDIDYDDGEKETRVDEKLINALEGASPGKNLRGDSGGRMSVGDKVEAHYKGRSKLYKGEISRVNADGTFDIAYDDGERETRVTEDLIKQIGGASVMISSPPRRGRLSEGAKVEARYRGKSKFYPGRIFKDRGDSTYDVHYDDGEKETRVAADLIQPVGGAGVTNSRQSPRQSPPPRRGRLSEGAKVEARYRGRSKFYPGRISRDRGDGTFDIDYDDGEKETRVAEELITAAGGGGGREVASNLRRGEKVEARYRGRSKYYTGRVTRVCGDGAYDIDYDDGEKEQGVAEALIRSLEQSPSDGYQLSALD